VPADDLIVQTAVASASPRLVSGIGRWLAFLEQEKAGSVLQREPADTIILLDEIATHRSVIEACLVSMSQASWTITVPAGLFGVT
jgi:hypothetical protein